MDVLHFFNTEADSQRNEIAKIQSRLFFNVFTVIVIMLALIASLIWQIRRQNAAQSQLERIAHFDDVTDLANRTQFMHKLRKRLEGIRDHKENQLFAIAYIDIDNFKDVNDRFGHATGDKYLKQISDRLKTLIGERGLPARLGGDEFVILIDRIVRPNIDEPIFKDLQQALRAPVTLEGIQVTVSASIGIALHHPRDNLDADQLLRQADAAMYSAKRAGRDCIVFFDAALERSLQTQSELSALFSDAIDADELTLYYQPKFDLRTRQVLGVEALLRWKHPTKGLLTPYHFLDAISLDSNLMDKLTDWVLSRAIAQTTNIKEDGRPLEVSVNVNLSNYREAGDRALQRLTSWTVSHPEIMTGRIILEILESNVIIDMETMGAAMRAARKAGVRFALDDFGTGYSSLSYLKNLPLDELKIDKSFILDMLNNEDSKRIILAILKLAEAFELEVIAEGVETESHAQMLLELGCTRIQGYYIAHPMEFSELTTWLTQRHDYTGL